jgi:hypothetical protein
VPIKAQQNESGLSQHEQGSLTSMSDGLLAAINNFKGGSRLGTIVSVVSMRKRGSGNETCCIEHVWECLTKIEPIWRLFTFERLHKRPVEEYSPLS